MPCTYRCSLPSFPRQQRSEGEESAEEEWSDEGDEETEVCVCVCVRVYRGHVM